MPYCIVPFILLTCYLETKLEKKLTYTKDDADSEGHGNKEISYVGI